MRKILLSLLLVILLFPIKVTLANSGNKEIIFRGLYWGESKESVQSKKEIIYVEPINSQSTRYEVNIYNGNEERSLAAINIIVWDIFFSKDNKLEAMSFQFEEPSTELFADETVDDINSQKFKHLTKAIDHHLGISHTEINEDLRVWETKSTRYFLRKTDVQSRSKTNGTGVQLAMFSKEIEKNKRYNQGW